MVDPSEVTAGGEINDPPRRDEKIPDKEQPDLSAPADASLIDFISTQPLPTEEDTAPLRLSRPPAAPQPFSTQPTPPGETAISRQAGAGYTPPASRTGTNRPEAALPQMVNQVDEDATQVSPAAYSPPRANPRPVATTRPAPRVSGGTPPPAAPRTARVVSSPRRSNDLNRSLGCFLRLFFAGLFSLVLLSLCVVSILFYQYYRIASTLPEISDLSKRASQFETTRILDRNGNELYEILDPNAGRRTYVPLQKISPYLLAATIATEDKGYYSHPGFDVFAIVRAFYQNYQSGETVSGASTITQQLVRSLLFTPQERTEQSYQRKVREAILAAEITRRYSKDEILELYLNEIYYGNMAYGIEAAAETYFGTTSDKLSLAQAAFLAGLPQAPAVYDIYTNPDATLKRQENVLALMYQSSLEQNCIYVSNSPQRICIDPVAVTSAVNETKKYQFKSPSINMRYPHWVNYIRALLEAQYDPQRIYRSGFTVYTTLDPAIQDLSEKAVSEQLATLKKQNAKDGALVAIRPGTGEIMAMVGSADFYNEAIAGQVNMAISPRQPGSSIKPLTYLAAFEKGWTPSTLIWDVPSEFPPSGRQDDPSPPYKPVNYDGRFRGPVTVRAALANSYNIPAVKALQFVGIYEDPINPGKGGFIEFAKRMGITTLTRQDYGLSLTLGGGEVTLLDMTEAFATLANNGMRVPPVAITRILDHSGTVIYDYKQPVGQQVVRPEYAYLITSILSDNRARTPAFGANSVLNLPFPAAVKTGTTNDFRDNWTVGYTPDLAIGTWVGNADYTPMVNTSGVSGAAPIWSQVMQSAVPQLTKGNQTPFTRPPGVVEQVVCDVSGTSPSQWCPKQHSELFAIDQPPQPKENDLWQKAVIDTWTGLRASQACPDFIDEKFVMNVTDPWAIKWIRQSQQGQAWAKSIGFDQPVTFAPARECKAGDPHPDLQFVAPRDNDTIQDNPLNIFGIANAANGFQMWHLDYGMGDKPVDWQTLEQSRKPVNQPDLLTTWDLSGFPDGVATLRLYLQGANGAYAERRIRLNIQVPTPTPTPTPTDTPEPPPTEKPYPTDTPPPPQDTPQDTPMPTDTQQAGILPPFLATLFANP